MLRKEQLTSNKGRLHWRHPGIENFEARAENSPDQTGQSVVWLRPVCVQRKHLLFTHIERGNEALRTAKSQNRGV